MKVNQYFSVFFILLLSTSFANANTFQMRGGVIVGNGGRITAGLNEGFYPSEDELLTQVEQTVRLIRQGKHPRVQQWIQQGACSGQMDFESMEVFTTFKPVKDQWQKGVVGYSRILLKDCKQPLSIDADEPPAGSDNY